MGCWCSSLPDGPNSQGVHPKPHELAATESPFKSTNILPAAATTGATGSPLSSAPLRPKAGSGQQNDCPLFRSYRDLLDPNNHLDSSCSTLKQNSGPGGIPSAVARSSHRLDPGASCSHPSPLLLLTTVTSCPPDTEFRSTTRGAGAGPLELEEQEYERDDALDEAFSNHRVSPRRPELLHASAHAATGQPAQRDGHGEGSAGEQGSSCFSRELLESVVPMILRASYEPRPAGGAPTVPPDAGTATAGSRLAAPSVPSSADPGTGAGAAHGRLLPRPSHHPYHHPQPPHRHFHPIGAGGLGSRPSPAGPPGLGADVPEASMSVGSDGPGGQTAATNLTQRPTFIRGLTRDSFLMNNTTTTAGGGGSGYMLRTGTAREELIHTATRWPPFQMGNPLQLDIGTMLGRGGCGSVYTAEWRGRPVAVKVVQQVVAVPPTAANAAAAAAAAAAGGACPASPPSIITPLIDYFSTSSGGAAEPGGNRRVPATVAALGVGAAGAAAGAVRAPHLPDAHASVKRLRHPNILRTHAYAALSLAPQLGGVLPARHEHHVVLELCDGGSLRAWLDEAHRKLTTSDASATAAGSGGGGVPTADSAVTAAAAAAAVKQAIDRAQAHMAGAGAAVVGAGLGEAAVGRASGTRGNHDPRHDPQSLRRSGTASTAASGDSGGPAAAGAPAEGPDSSCPLSPGRSCATPTVPEDGPLDIGADFAVFPVVAAAAADLAPRTDRAQGASRIQSCPGATPGEAHSTALAAADAKPAAGAAAASEKIVRIMSGLSPELSHQLQLLGLTWVSDGEATAAAAPVVPPPNYGATVSDSADVGGGAGVGQRGLLHERAWMAAAGAVAADGSCMSVSAMSDPSGCPLEDRPGQVHVLAGGTPVWSAGVWAGAGAGAGAVSPAAAGAAAAVGAAAAGGWGLKEGCGGGARWASEGVRIGSRDMDGLEPSGLSMGAVIKAIGGSYTGLSTVGRQQAEEAAAAAATAAAAAVAGAADVTEGAAVYNGDLGRLEVARGSQSPPTAELAAVWAGPSFQAYCNANFSVGSIGGSTMAQPESCCMAAEPVVQQHYVILGDPNDDDEEEDGGDERADGTDAHGDSFCLHSFNAGGPGGGMASMFSLHTGNCGSLGSGDGRRGHAAVGRLGFRHNSRLQQLEEDSQEGSQSRATGTGTMSRTTTIGTEDQSASASAGASAAAPWTTATTTTTATASGDPSPSAPQRRFVPALPASATVSTLTSGPYGTGGSATGSAVPTQEDATTAAEAQPRRALRPPVFQEACLLGPTVNAKRRSPADLESAPAPGPLGTLTSVEFQQRPPRQPLAQPLPLDGEAEAEAGDILTTLLNRRAVGMVNSILRAAGMSGSTGSAGGSGGAATAAALPPPERSDPMQRAQIRHLVTALDCLADIAYGLSYLHGVGMVHGDVKSGNVLLKLEPRHPRGFVLKLADFGFARVLEHGSYTYLSRPSGTLAYLCPELLTSHRQSSSADMYAFGMLAWEVVTAQPLFRGLQTPQLLYAKTHNADWQYLKWPPWCPHDVRSVARRCADFHPAARLTAPQARALLEQLRSKYAGLLCKDFGEEVVFAPRAAARSTVARGPMSSSMPQATTSPASTGPPPVASKIDASDGA